MALSAVEICSRALVRIGSSGIQSFADGSSVSSIASSVYTSILEAELSMYPWRFAMKKATLSQLSSVPTNEYKFAYQLPTDRIGEPFSVFNSTQPNAATVQNFEIFSDKLFTNAQTVVIDYTFKPAEPSFPPYFTEFLVLAIASTLAVPVTDQTSKADYFRQLAYGLPSDNGNGGQLARARRTDSQQQPPQGIDSFSLIDARFI